MYLDRDKELNMFPTLMDVILNSYDGGIGCLTWRFVKHGNKRDGVNYFMISHSQGPYTYQRYLRRCLSGYPKYLVAVKVT